MKTQSKKLDKNDLKKYQGEKKPDQVIKPINFFQYQIEWCEKNNIKNLSQFIRDIFDRSTGAGG